MEQGVSKMSYILGSIFMSAAIVGIVMYLVFTGNNLRDEGLKVVFGVNEAVSSRYVAGLRDGALDSAIPSASAYSLLTSHSSSIVDVVNAMTGKIVNLQTQQTDLINYLSGEVQLQIEPHISGEYYAVIHSPTCIWYEGICTCAKSSVARDYKTAYGLR